MPQLSEIPWNVEIQNCAICVLEISEIRTETPLYVGKWEA